MANEVVTNSKAVAVAQDVLDRLDNYKVFCGGYVRGYAHVDVNTDLRDNLEVVQKSCTVCALGACLLAKARLYDAVPMHVLVDGVRDILNNSREIRYLNLHRPTIDTYLADVFDDAQRDMIESAFELYRIGVTSFAVNYEARRRDDAIAFGKKYLQHGDRLAAIMANIVDNGGVFDPPFLTLAWR